MKLPQYDEIPDALDYLPYAVEYYDEVKKIALTKFGKQANLLQATEAMNLLGNVSFFAKFPACYNNNKETLSKLYQPYFELLDDDPIHDYLHGLAHIRSKSEHTLMGEAMLSVDEFYINSHGYPKLTEAGKSVNILQSEHIPWDYSKYKTTPLPKEKLALLDIKNVIRRAKRRRPYQTSYVEGKYMCDFPDHDKLSKDFLTKPINTFEERLASNLVRAIYMDEKYKLLSSTKSYFRDTSIKVSVLEPIDLAFTTSAEEDIISNIWQAIHSEQAKQNLAVMAEHYTVDCLQSSDVIAYHTLSCIQRHYI